MQPVDHTISKELYRAASRGDNTTLKSLLCSFPHLIDHQIDYGSSLIHEAAKNNHVTTIELLVQMGSRMIDVPNIVGQTPMHVAAYNGHELTIETLVRLGSRVTHVLDNNKWTPMETARIRQQICVMSCLYYLGVTPHRFFSHYHYKNYDESEASEIRRRVYFTDSLLMKILNVRNTRSSVVRVLK